MTLSMTTTLIQNVIAVTSAALGAFIAIGVGVSHRQLCALISIAAGTLFATTFLNIVPEAIGAVPLVAILLALASGYLLFYLISRFFFHVCPACAASHFDEQMASAFRSIAVLLVIALGIHCIFDGVAIALGSELEKKSGWSIFLTVTIHKFPEGLALCALLMRAGVDRTKAFISTSAVEALTLLGWVAGEFSLGGLRLGPWFYLTLVHIGGGFIYLALHAVLNESKAHSPRYVVFFFLCGALTIGLASALIDRL